MKEKETVEIKTLKFYRNKLEDYLEDYILEKGYEYEAPYIKKDDILEILDTFKQKKILQDKLDKIKEYIEREHKTNFECGKWVNTLEIERIIESESGE